MTESTAIVSYALQLLVRGNTELEDPFVPTPRREEVAMGLLEIMGALANEYDPGHFTDEEIELITNTTMVCLDTLVNQAQEGS